MSADEAGRAGDDHVHGASEPPTGRNPRQLLVSGVVSADVDCTSQHRSPMSHRSLVPALAVAAALVSAAPAPAAPTPDYAPGYVVVRDDAGTTRGERAALQEATG